MHRRVDIKATTKFYWTQVSKSLFGSWPELAQKKLGAVTEEECREWAGRYAQIISDNRYNNAVDFLRASQERAGNVVPLKRVRDMLSTMIHRCRERLLGILGRLSREFGAEVGELGGVLLEAALSELRRLDRDDFLQTGRR